MEVTISEKLDASGKESANAVVCFAFEKEKLPALAGELAGLAKSAVESNEFTGKANGVCYAGKGSDGSKLFLVGLGDKSSFTLEQFRKAVGKAVWAVVGSGGKVETLSLKLDNVSNATSAISAADVAACAVETTMLAQYSFLKYKPEKEQKEKKQISKIVLGGVGASSDKQVNAVVQQAIVVADATNYTRDMANEPANFATPAYLARQAKATSEKSKNVTLTVFEKDELQKMGFGALLAVAAGSIQPPVFAVMDYKPAKYSKTLALVGKGITFDSGGISIKPSKDMDQMKFDKSGACAVIGAIQAISKLELPIRVLGVFAATENMPGGKATKPGDIARAYTGKTIEILNTDAEGRLILSDSIGYTIDKYKPDYLVDIATLTGACVVALGNECSGLMGNNDAFVKLVQDAGEKSGDRAWPLPLWPEYEERIKSDIAEIKNLGAPEGAGGAITAGAFLKAFVDSKTKWAHLDVAGTAWATGPRAYFTKGATGNGVRLFTTLAQELSKK